MTDEEQWDEVVTRDLFRCDYCSTLTDVGRETSGWESGDDIDGGHRLWHPVVYCGPYCQRQAVAGGVRISR